MRALEVLYRNGHRKAPSQAGRRRYADRAVLRAAGHPIRRARPRQERRQVDRPTLYLRRWTSAPKDSDEARELRRAWFQVEKVAPGYSGKQHRTADIRASVARSYRAMTGVLSQHRSSRRQQQLILPRDPGGRALYAAGRCWPTALSEAQPSPAAASRWRSTSRLKNLWDVVGAAGNPPKDQAKIFAMMSLCSWPSRPLRCRSLSPLCSSRS